MNRTLLTVFVMLALAGVGHGASYTATSGAWDVAASWTPAGGPPTATDDATIPSGVTIQVKSITVYVNTITVNGVLELKATGHNTPTLTISGNLINNGSITTSTGPGALVFDASKDHYVIGSGTITTTAQKPLNWSTADASAIYFDSNAVTGLNGSFTLGANSTIGTANPNGLNGSITSAGPISLPATTDYVFNANGPQVTGLLMPTTVDNVTLGNNTTLTFTNDTTITGTLTQNSGSVAGTNIPATDGFTSPYLTVAYSGSLLDNFTGYSTAPTNTYPVSIDRSYYLSSATTGVTKSVTFYWTPAEDHNYNWTLADPPYVTLGANNYTGTLTIGPAPDYMRSMTVSITSPYSGAATVSNSGGTLPVELSSFTAVMSATNYVQLQWVTQSETNVSGYRLYRHSTPDLETATMLNAFIQATNTSQMQVYVYWDDEVWESGTYYYWLQNLDFDGSSSFHGPVSITVNLDGGGSPVIPVIQGISSIYPNPFNPNTAVRLGIVRPGNVKVAVYNTRGQMVRELFEGFRDQGTHTLQWDGTDANGSALPSGMYVIRMTSGTQVYQRKAILMK